MYYFLSDAHLGCKVIKDEKAHEQKLVDWLDMVRADATEIYLLGDIFDFWFEYKYTVPKGFTRLLGKLREITESGITVHFFAGNHDLWTFGYLEKECGLIVHHGPITVNLEGKTFYLAHGDGLGDKSLGFKIIRGIFHSKTLQWMFRNLLPSTWGMAFGYKWSENNRKKHMAKDNSYRGEDKEPLVIFAKRYAETHSVDYMMFGHRHLLLNLMLKNKTQMIILGDFLQEFSYAKFDGQNISLEHFESTKNPSNNKSRDSIFIEKQ